MSEQKPRVVSIGEATIEFVRGGDGRFAVSCAGDTFNVAIYLARAGIDAAFATALGDDPYSDAILALAAAEGVARDLVLRTRGRLPGLTVTDTDTTGGRHRHEWRGESPARQSPSTIGPRARSLKGSAPSRSRLRYQNAFV